MSLRKVRKLDKLPKQCDLCKQYIGLYEPFYTIMMDSYFVKGKRLRNYMVAMCPNCWDAYHKYLTKREENFIHKKARAEVEGRAYYG